MFMLLIAKIIGVLKFTSEGELIASLGTFGSGPGQMSEFITLRLIVMKKFM